VTPRAARDRPVLLMCHDYPPLTGGGLAGAVRDLAALLQPDFDVVIVASRVLDHYADDRNLVPRRSRLQTAVTAWRAARCADCIVVHWTFSFRWLSSMAILTGPLLRRPTLCVVHTAPLHLRYNRLRFLPPPVRRRLPRLAAVVARRCAGVVALSGAHAESLRRVGFPPTHVAPAPVQHARLAAVFQGRQESRRVDVAGYAGEFSRLKGTDALAGLIPALVPEFGLRLAGRGPLAGRLDAAMAALHPRARERVSMSAPLAPDRMAGFFAGVDVVLAPSRTESQGRLVIEAMLAGAVVIARPSAGIEDVVQEGRTGFLVDPGDPAAVLACLRWLRAAPNVVAAVRRAARQAAEELVLRAERDWQALVGALTGPACPPDSLHAPLSSPPLLPLPLPPPPLP
jgi:glycosyltransferase involved in cell wall biosynthesis